MNRAGTLVLAATAAAALAAGGYWFGRTSAPRQPQAETLPTAAQPLARSERTILYYRNPMGLPDTSATPKRDPMGMDYVPVYEGEELELEGGANLVKISTDKVQKLGVRTEAAQERDLTRTVLAAGIVEANERGLATVAPKFEGWIERLYVNTTGQAIARGQPVAEIYSPELVSAQREYLIARAGKAALAKASGEALRGMGDLEQYAATRLRNWDITTQQIERLATEGDVRRTLTLTSPVSGVVIEKPAVQGMRFMPGDVLLKIADLSTVWLIAEVFEQDISSVRVGQEAVVRFNAYAERNFRGKVSFVYPTLNPETRTAKVRIDLPNPDGALKPSMYGTVQLAAGSRARGLTVPDSAVIDSGSRRVVLVQRGEGRFEPREVKTGARSDGYVEIREGVAAGEAVVVKANFLIDAESNLKAALGSFGHAGHGGASTSKTDPPKPPGTQVASREGSVAKEESGAVHRAEGSVQAVNAKEGRVTLVHGPVPSLKWPAMTMDFQVADPSVLAALKPGQNIRFEFVEDRAGRYVIQSVAVVAPAPDTHTGH